MKKIITALIIVLIAIPLVLWLIYLPEEIQAKYKSESVDWSQVHDDPAEKLIYNIIVNSKEIPKPSYYKLLEDRFNVEFNIQYIKRSVWNKKKGLLMASGKIPDVFVDEGGSLRNSIQHDFILPIPLEVIAKYIPDHAKRVNEWAPYGWAAGYVNNQNYSVPLLAMHFKHPRTGTWRLDWLRNVGINKIPETLDEFYKAFRAFRYDDPDVNGENDTWGLTGDLLSWYTTFTEIFGAYGILPYDCQLKNGELVFGGIQLEAKQALEYLHKLYDEGIIHPDFITDQWFSGVNAKLYSGKIGYVNYFSSYETYDKTFPGSSYNRMKKLQPEAELAPAILPRGPDGKSGHRTWGISSNSLVFGKPVKEQPEKAIRYLKILNEIVTDEELYVVCSIGQRGVHWDWSEKGEEFGTRQLSPYREDHSLLEAQGLSTLKFAEKTALGVGPSADIYEKYLPEGLLEFRKKYRKEEWGMRNPSGRPDINPAIAVIYDRIQTFQMTVYQEFIRGSRDLSTFDEFVEEWRALGGDEYLEAMKKFLVEQQSLEIKIKKLINNE